MKRYRLPTAAAVLASLAMYLVTCAAGQPPREQAGPAEAASQGGQLTVKVTNVRGKEGEIVISLFTKQDGFPSDISKAAKTATVATNQPNHTFTNLPAGKYVVVVFHDKNKNGRLDKSAFGPPREPIGLSNHPKISPPANMPNFERAKVEVSKATSVEVNLIELGR